MNRVCGRQRRQFDLCTARDGVRNAIFFHDTLERDAKVLLGHKGHADEQPERRERVDSEAAGLMYRMRYISETEVQL